jgi:hypothetical protein
MALPTVVQHLRVLEDAGIVTSEKISWNFLEQSFSLPVSTIRRRSELHDDGGGLSGPSPRDGIVPTIVPVGSQNEAKRANSSQGARSMK